MRRASIVAFLLVLTASAVLLLTPAGRVISQEMQDVFVVNFPDPQKVRGRVSVEGTIRNAELVTLEDIIVSPVGPEDTNRLIRGGVLETDGYPYVVISMSGIVKGTVVRPGIVGLVMVPDEEPITRAFDEEGQMQFPLEITAPAVTAASPYFASNSERFTVAFPRYRLLFYNTSDKTVSLNVYAYLTND